MLGEFGKAIYDGSPRYAEKVANFLLIHAIDVVQPCDSAGLFRDTRQYANDEVSVGESVAGSLLGFGTSLNWSRSHLAATQLAQAVVCRDAIDPAQSFTRVRGFGQMALDANKRLLRGVLCRGVIAQNAAASSVDCRSIRSIEESKFVVCHSAVPGDLLCNA